MRIQSVSIRRFKRLEEVTIPLAESTFFVGANNSGKNSVLQALGAGKAPTASPVTTVLARSTVALAPAEPAIPPKPHAPVSE